MPTIEMTEEINGLMFTNPDTREEVKEIRPILKQIKGGSSKYVSKTNVNVNLNNNESVIFNGPVNYLSSPVNFLSSNDEPNKACGRKRN